jgi:hypothetical protein
VELRDVSNILWRERHLLDLLLFKLEEEQLLLAAGRTRWIAQATREVEMVLEEIKQTELSRAMVVDQVAPGLGLEPGPSLRALAEAAPDPWSTLLSEHRAAFLTATEEIVALAQTNRELLTQGQQAARDVLATLGEARVETYSPTGAAAEGPVRPMLIDEVL